MTMEVLIRALIIVLALGAVITIFFAIDYIKAVHGFKAVFWTQDDILEDRYKKEADKAVKEWKKHNSK